MPTLRLCSHIKTNGIKCGSPALRHHTLCYFHYQWQRRDQRRIRLSGPIGMGKNSGIELPLLDGPEAILLSIMEIQHALIDQRIPIKMGTALLYSLQLVLQAKISAFGLGHSGSVRECPELDNELEMERARAMRPAKEKCAACPKRDDCLSPRNCRKLPKVPGYHRVGDRLVPNKPEVAQQTDSSSRAESLSDVVEGPASLPIDTTQPCHPERSAAVSRGAEGPCVSPAEATTLSNSPIPQTSTALDSVRESSPAGDCGESAPPKFPPSRAHARRQVDATEEKQTVLRLRDSRRCARDDTSKTDAISYAHCILGSNPMAHIDLQGKFPQLVEIKREQN
ncbi:MAG: hypothetical protein ROO76_22035 [Terriglobia bacterium]|nr:hypothetical protein [Terriglobia bacterium]